MRNIARSFPSAEACPFHRAEFQHRLRARGPACNTEMKGRDGSVHLLRQQYMDPTRVKDWSTDAMWNLVKLGVDLLPFPTFRSHSDIEGID
jgi:hypothetical protein